MVVYDSSQKLCRVAVLGAKNIDAVTAAVGPLAGDWVAKQDDPVANLSVFTGTFMGSPKMTFRIRKPPAGNRTYGSANYMFSFLPAS